MPFGGADMHGACPYCAGVLPQRFTRYSVIILPSLRGRGKGERLECKGERLECKGRGFLYLICKILPLPTQVSAPRAVYFDMNYSTKMTHKTIGLMLLATAVIMVSCAVQRKSAPGKPTDVRYTLARNYYYVNDADDPQSPMVTTQRAFDRLFGMAAVMGKGGEPTHIDFSRQFVIGIVLPLTNDNTEVVPTRLVAHGDTLTMHYRLKTTERNMSWTMRPMAIVVVDRRHQPKTCRLARD